jgi:hypothetical protein
MEARGEGDQEPCEAPEAEPSSLPKSAQSLGDAVSVARLEDPPVIGEPFDGLGRLPARLVGTCLSTVFGTHNAYVVIGASEIGADHGYSVDSAEDAFGYSALAEGIALAVADGATRSPKSAYASRVAVRHALEAITNDCDDDAHAVLTALRVGGDAVTAEARENDNSPDDWATTLTVAFIPNDSEQPVHCASIGNTHIYALDGGHLLRIAPPGTSFVTWPKAMRDIQHMTYPLKAGQGLLLATDGVGVDLDRSTPVREWFAQNLLSARSPLDAGRLLAYHRDGSADDRTFILVRRAQRGA